MISAAANALEDALGMKDLGSVYVFGNVVGGFAMIGLTNALVALHARAFAPSRSSPRGPRHPAST